MSDSKQFRRRVSTVILVLCLLVAVGFAAYVEGKRRGMLDPNSRGAVGSVLPLSNPIPRASVPAAMGASLFDVFGSSLILDPPSDGVLQLDADLVRLRPDNPDAHLSFGAALYLKGNYTAAASEFRKAVKLRPDEAAAHNDLGVALYALGDHKLAMEEFKVATNKGGGASYAQFNARYVDLVRGTPDYYGHRSARALSAAPAAESPPK